MVVAPRRSRGRRPWAATVFLAAIVLGTGGVFAYLLTGRTITLDFLEPPLVLSLGGDEVRASERAVPAGHVRVPVSGRAIPAYTKVSRDDVWNLERGEPAYLDVAEELVGQAGIFVEVQAVVGRVLARPKSPGYVFTEADFLPVGTRPGIVGGIPPGKRALRVEVGSVRGLVGLNPGDRFDVVAAVPLDGGAAGRAADLPFAGVYAEQMGLQASLAGLAKQARVDVLVQNGVVVSPVETRMIPRQNTSLTRGTTTSQVPVQEVVLAVEPDEVAPLLEAIAIEADVSCLARSGRPDDDPASRTPSSAPRSTFWGPHGGLGPTGEPRPGAGTALSLVETIGGGDREIRPVPTRATAGPPSPAEDG